MKKLFFLFIPIIISYIGCDDFIEEDISSKTIEIAAPPDNFQSSISTQTFWWNEMEGAESYNVQIVRGTFSYVQQVIFDSSIVTHSFTYTLQPGNYQWRVKGVNNGWESPYTTYSLTIDSTLDLTNQQVVLTAPVNNFYTQETQIVFNWMELYNADEYRIQIMDLTTGVILTDVTIPENTYNYTLSEGSYIWSVRAINSNSITVASSRNLFIDLTSPVAPVLISPPNNVVLTIGANDSLIWSVDASSSSDSVLISTDSTFYNYESSFTTETFHVLNQLPGVYFWKVKSMDLAGNQSQFSPYRKFTIQ